MAATVEDLDRRVTALELAQSARGENALARLEGKVEALHRVTAEMIAESEQRLSDRINSTEGRFVDLLNERFDAVMAALDRPKNL
jgi:hypothetical protein